VGVAARRNRLSQTTLELVDPPTRRVLQTLPALPTHRVLSYCAADVVYSTTILTPELQRLASSWGDPKDPLST